MALTAHPETSLRQRIGEAFAAKRAIARVAAAEVRPGETVLLDAGSSWAAREPGKAPRIGATVFLDPVPRTSTRPHDEETRHGRDRVVPTRHRSAAGRLGE
jgi:hypothetical protein